MRLTGVEELSCAQFVKPFDHEVHDDDIKIRKGLAVRRLVTTTDTWLHWSFQKLYGLASKFGSVYFTV